MTQGWFQSTPGTPSYRRRHATKTGNPHIRHAGGHVRCAGTGSDSRIRFPNRTIRPAAAARTREPRPTRKGGISWFVDDDRPVAQQGTH